MSDDKINVKVGEVRVGSPGHVLFAIGLGSCVGVALYDARAKVGGLAHVMLPAQASARRPGPPGRFAPSAVEYLIDEMVKRGAVKRRLYARLVGGASMFENVLNDDGPSLGDRNVVAVRKALEEAGVPITAEEVGGNHGRTVHFYIEDGRLHITSVRFPDVNL